MVFIVVFFSQTKLTGCALHFRSICSTSVNDFLIICIVSDVLLKLYRICSIKLYRFNKNYGQCS